jgi:two-component system, cell cycle response regulator DivK
MANELILIVEDDANSRKLVRDVLQVKGYRTIESETAEEGIRLAKEQRPVLILMDIQLPGMSGIDALRLLRADPETEGIPTIAVSAAVMTAQQQNVLEAGFDAFEPKPISIAALLKTIQVLIERKHDEKT